MLSRLLSKDKMSICLYSALFSAPHDPTTSINNTMFIPTPKAHHDKVSSLHNSISAWKF